MYKVLYIPGGDRRISSINDIMIDWKPHGGWSLEKVTNHPLTELSAKPSDQLREWR